MSTQKMYDLAKEQYAAMGVDTEAVLEQLAKVKISLHCWQGDDVAGFEASTGLTGGIMATGNYPGRARNGEELRADLDKALALIPGKHKVNVHAIYAETNGVRVDRDALEAKHFQNWIDWAKANGLGLDFNGSFFSHEKSASGFTLSHSDDSIRQFWVEHGKRSREIGEAMGKATGQACVTNIWVPDGAKDMPANRKAPRERLKRSLDAVLADKKDTKALRDAVECKLFGIGSESYVVGSHEFYMGYAMKNDVMLCMDMGHFHPTELVSDKISSVLTFQDELLLHVSRGIRWDSDHVVVLSDEVTDICREIKRADAFGKVHIALDFFDASINRLTAWVTGSRAALKACAIAMLEPTAAIQAAENEGNLGNRLALLEEAKGLPWQAVWNMFCERQGTAVGGAWINEINAYEKNVLSKR